LRTEEEAADRFPASLAVGGEGGEGGQHEEATLYL